MLRYHRHVPAPDDTHSPSFGAFADIYDAIYAARGKDYAAEAARVAELILRHRPQTRTLLDVACGTGEHLRHLAETFTVAGLDRSSAMLRIAAEKLPGVPLHEDDLLHADIGARFGAVTCLFSSVGYLADVTALTRAALTMSRHLTPLGIVALETAVLPADLTAPRPDRTEIDLGDGRVLTRRTNARLDEDRLIIDFHFSAHPETDGFPFRERHELRIFPVHAYIGALARAGLTVIDRTPFGRGTQLLLAVRHGSCTSHPPC